MQSRSNPISPVLLLHHSYLVNYINTNSTIKIGDRWAMFTTFVFFALRNGTDLEFSFSCNICHFKEILKLKELIELTHKHFKRHYNASLAWENTVFYFIDKMIVSFKVPSKNMMGVHCSNCIDWEYFSYEGNLPDLIAYWRMKDCYKKPILDLVGNFVSHRRY